MASTADFKNGLIIKYNGELHQIMEYQHRTPGNLRAFVQAKMKNLRTGRTLENRFRSGEEVEIVRVERRRYQYLYAEGSDLVFMDQESYEQIHVAKDLLGESVQFLKEGEACDLLMNDVTPIGGELPITVALRVTHTEPGLKGDTATGGTKKATVETGAIVNVPLFISEGEVLKIDTRTGAYLERVKE